MVIIILPSMQLTQFTTKKTEKGDLIMKENIKRDSAIDLFNGILKTARDAGALQDGAGI